MHTFQIADSLLNDYKNDKLGEKRIDFLTAQAEEQLDEISQNKDLYDSFLSRVNAPKNVDRIILWILLMSNETICEEYISEFDKGFREIIPVSDLADLLLYVVYSKKVKDISIEGFDYLLEYNGEGLEEVDQYAFTNALLYVQKSKEAEMEF